LAATATPAAAFRTASNLPRPSPATPFQVGPVMFIYKVAFTIFS
jgi:hypothetical protein